MSAVFPAIRSELIKICTLPGTWLTTGVVLTLHTLAHLQAAPLFAEAVADITPDGMIEIFIGRPEPAAEALLEQLVASSLQMGLFLPILAVVMAGQEFRSHQLGATVLAVPRRGRLLVAKILAAAGYLLFVAVLIAGISTAFMYAAVESWNPGLLLTSDAFLGHGKFVVFAVLFSLTIFAITIIVRGALAGIVAAAVLITLTMTQVATAIAPALDALLPLSAGRNLLLNPETNQLSAGPVHALCVLAGWTLVTTALARVALGVRDAR